MENLTLENLRELQTEALNNIEGAREETKVRRGRGGKQNFGRIDEESEAGEIIAQIPHRARDEAKYGRGYAIIMSLDRGDYERPSKSDWKTCEAKWLKLTAHLVYEYCEEQGLEPTIEYWYKDRDAGLKSGFNILVHW